MWCFKSEGLNKVNHLEVVVMLEIRRKEDVFPEEVLRVYKGILFLATKHGKWRLEGTTQVANARYSNKFKGSSHPMNEVKDFFPKISISAICKISIIILSGSIIFYFFLRDKNGVHFWQPFTECAVQSHGCGFEGSSVKREFSLSRTSL